MVMVTIGKVLHVRRWQQCPASNALISIWWQAVIPDCQMLNVHFRNGQSTIMVTQSGENSPNLVRPLTNTRWGKSGTVRWHCYSPFFCHAPSPKPADAMAAMLFRPNIGGGLKTSGGSEYWRPNFWWRCWNWSSIWAKAAMLANACWLDNGSTTVSLSFSDMAWRKYNINSFLGRNSSNEEPLHWLQLE